MEVTEVVITPSSGCPNDKVTAKAYVTMFPGFDRGSVDFYTREFISGTGKFTPWKWACEITGLSGGALGGQEIAEAKITIPRRSTGNTSGNVYIGAVGSNQKTTDVPNVSALFTPPREETEWTVSAVPTSGPAPLTVEFTTRGLNAASDVNWDFYDGSTGEGKTITHTYEEAGSYLGRATPINACGDDYTTSKFTKKITVTGDDGPDEPDDPYEPGRDDCFYPPGKHGDFDCVGTTKVKCDNGLWIIIQRNSPDCPPDEPDEPRYKSCTDPVGEHGEHACDGTTEIRCFDGRWNIIMRNSPHCPPDGPDIPDEPDPPDPPAYRSCKNPYGEHDDYDCAGTTKIRCNDGQWVAVEWNSPDCPPDDDTGGNGQPDVPGYCTNPYGTRGDVFCDDTTLMRCDGSRWVIQEYNSNQCPSQSALAISREHIYMGVGLAAAFGLAYVMMQRR